MPLDQNVLGVIGDIQLGGKLVGGMVVLKDSSINIGTKVCFDIKSRSDFKKEITDGKQSLKAHTQSQIFGFSSGQCDL